MWPLNHLYQHALMRRLKRRMYNAVFIVGAGRSGTTAVCRAMNEHSRVLIAPGEGPLVNGFGRVAHQYRFGPQSEYYRSNTGMSCDRFRNDLGSLCFRCVWGGASVRQARPSKPAACGRRRPCATGA